MARNGFDTSKPIIILDGNSLVEYGSSNGFFGTALERS